jgi:tRNA (guanine-N(7)-)-methyltransferase subunit TRM82
MASAKIPYQCICLHRDILFAARGSRIYTFRLSDGFHVSTWSHPVAAELAKAAGGKLIIVASPTASGSNGNQDPPAKRRKVEELADGNGDEDDVEPLATGSPEDNDTTLKTIKKPRKGGSSAEISPIINVMQLSADGSHLVAVTGQDKAIWVFEHDGEGNLTELSKRFP